MMPLALPHPDETPLPQGGQADAGTDGSTARFMAKVKARPTDPASAGPLTLLLKTRTASVEQAILPD